MPYTNNFNYIEFVHLQSTFTPQSRVVYKRVIILLTFLAYFLTLIHSLVPHHHDEEAKNHHHHQGEKDHHHHESDNDNKPLNYAFADAIHHPASDVVIITPKCENVLKNNKVLHALAFQTSQILFPELKPPDIPIHHQEKHYSSNESSFFLLRAPPVA